MTDDRTPHPEPQADGLEDMAPRAPDAIEQANVTGGGGVIEDRSLATTAMGDGSVRLGDGSVRMGDGSVRVVRQGISGTP